MSRADFMLGVVLHACTVIPATQEAEVGRSQFLGQSR